MSPDGEGDDAESPMPHPSQISQAVRRRGAISAEPITEEDVATYVKKVIDFFGQTYFWVGWLLFSQSSYDFTLTVIWLDSDWVLLEFDWILNES